MENKITYEQITTDPATIRVRLEGKRVGTIYENSEGTTFWQYFPLGHGNGGDKYPTLALVKQSLEG